MAIKIALQLYSIKTETQKDFVKSLERVAKIGYTGVEFAGYGDLKAKEMKNLLNDLGIESSGSHVSLDLLKNNLQQQIEYNLEIGNKYIVCPYAPIKTREDSLYLAEFLNQAAEECKEEGISVLYHNHAHEFFMDNGEYGLDILFQHGSQIQTEIDTYWVAKVGLNPAEYVKKYAGRTPLIHLKDKSKDADEKSTTLGDGTLDFGAIIEVAEGCEWFIVEQEYFEGSVWDSIEKNYKYLSERW